jgi:hypothetical protein
VKSEVATAGAIGSPAFYLMASRQNPRTGHGQFLDTRDKSRATRFSGLLKVTRCGKPKTIGRNLSDMVLALPHIRKLTLVQRVLHCVVIKRDFQ